MFEVSVLLQDPAVKKTLVEAVGAGLRLGDPSEIIIIWPF